MTSPLNQPDKRTELELYPEQELLWQLQSVCRRDIYEIAHIQTDDEIGSIPDPAALNQSERRSLVRAIFAYIEGVTFAIKGLAIHRTPNSKAASMEERYLAKEMSFELDDKGVIRSTRTKLRFLPNLKFAFQLYSGLRDFEFTLDTGSKEWSKMVASIRVRDRLTHPRSLGNLEVIDEEVRDALISFFWFDAELIRLIERDNMRLDEKIAQLKSKLDERAHP